MEKTAEISGGRSGSRSPDLLGVNEYDSAQIRQFVKSAKASIRGKGPFGSVYVPEVRTDCTLDEANILAMNALDFDCGPTNHKKPPANHIVYFVGGETGPVKIGFTQQPIKARLVCIQNGSPIKLHVLATLNCTRNNERLYHKRFAAHRLHGEWFERCPEIESEIARIKDTGNG